MARRLPTTRMLREMIIVSGVLSLGAAAVAGRLAWRNATTTLPVIMVLLTSFSYLNNSVSAMEWCLVIVISAAALWLLLRVPSGKEGLTVAGLASLGVLGSLARSDFGGQAAGYLAAAIFLWLLRRDRRYLLPSLALALGAGFGLGLATWRDYAISGEWLQSSAHMKQLWGHGGDLARCLSFGYCCELSFIFLLCTGRSSMTWHTTSVAMQAP